MNTRRPTIRGYVLFETPLGDAGLAWSDAGVARLQLPGAGPQTAARLLAEELGESLRRPEAPGPLRATLDAVRAHLAGHPQDFDGVALDLAGQSPFAHAVYAETRRVPAGRVTTYGAIAARLDKPGAARAVGAALGRNPVPLLVPCHRVVAADGALTGFSAPGGVTTKRALLALEGCPVVGAHTLRAARSPDRPSAPNRPPR